MFFLALPFISVTEAFVAGVVVGGTAVLAAGACEAEASVEYKDVKAKVRFNGNRGRNKDDEEERGVYLK